MVNVIIPPDFSYFVKKKKREKERGDKGKEKGREGTGIWTKYMNYDGQKYKDSNFSQATRACALK